LGIVEAMAFWSKRAPAGADLAKRIRQLAALDQRSGITFHQVKDDAGQLAAQLLSLDDGSYADALRDLLRSPAGVFRAYHLPAAVFGTPRARATLRTANDVKLVAEILSQAYGRQGLRAQARPFPFLMGPLKTLLVAAVGGVDENDPALESAMSSLADLLALEHPALDAVTGRCAPRLRQLSRARFESLLRRWLEAGRCLAKQMAVIRAAVGENSIAFEDLLLVLLDAPQPDPTSGWQARWASVRRSVDSAQMRQIVIGLIETGLSVRWLGDGEAVSLTRGAIWALADWHDPQARDLLESIVLAEVPRDVPANAGLWSLAHPGDEESLARLLKVSRTVRHRGLKTRADELLRRAAAARDETPESLADQMVPNHGLDQAGERVWELDAYRVLIRLTPQGDIDRVITGSDGKPRATVPKSLQDDPTGVWQDATNATRQLKRTLTAQKHRLEEAMVDGRSWSLTAWLATIGQNPVMASLAKRLVWMATFNDLHQFVMRDSGGHWKTHDGRGVAIPPNAMLSLAHLLAMPAADVEGWHRRIVAAGIVQPFRQLFREVYLVTPVEVEARDHSARFAGHSVPLAQVYALTKTRGWKGKLGLAGFYGAGEGWKEFPTKNLRVGLRHGGDDPQLALGVVEEVFFERRDRSLSRTKGWHRIPLSEVDPVVFSEAMRDVDLMVSAASLGRQFSSAEWEALQGPEREAWLAAQPRAEYLTQASAEARGRLLLQLAPLLGIQDRIHLDGHFALVVGKRGRYRVHLGTSSIYMEPGRHALCIIPAKGEARHILLPFEEGDYMTSLVFSKVLMLLDDDRITDVTILRQMGRPA